MFKSSLIHILLIPLFLTPACAEEAWQVTEKAWEAFADEDWDAVETLASRATQRWGAKAKEINDKLMPLHKSLFIESNPSPVKYAASLLNLCSDEVRLPLVKVTEKTKKEVEKALKIAKLL